MFKSNKDQKRRIRLNKLDFLLWYLKCFSFVERRKTTVLIQTISISAHVFVIITYFELLFVNLQALIYMIQPWKIIAAYVIMVSSSFANWLVMRTKGKRLTNLLRNMSHIPAPKNYRYENLAFLFTCSVPICVSLSYCIISLFGDNQAFNYLTYGKFIANVQLRSGLIFFKNIQVSFLNPSFTNIITLLYCRVVHKCCILLKRITYKVKVCQARKFTYSVQVETLQSKARAIKILKEIQEVFSLPSLLVCIASFSAGSIIVGALHSLSLQEYSAVLIVDTVYIGWLSITFLSAFIGVAGRVPIEMAKFREAFCEKIERRVFIGLDTEDAKLERGLYDTKDFVLSGAGVLHFRRSLLLTFVGTMLTYTFLSISSESKNSAVPNDISTQ